MQDDVNIIVNSSLTDEPGIQPPPALSSAFIEPEYESLFKATGMITEELKDEDLLDWGEMTSDLKSKNSFDWSDAPSKRRKVAVSDYEDMNSLDVKLNSLENCVELIFKKMDAVKVSFGLDNELKKEASKYGFSCYNAPGDGNCFFHAIVDQLKEIGLNEENLDTRTLRDKTAQYMSGHTDLLEFVAGETTDQYVSRMKKNGQWADNISITATANQFNLCIVILQNDKNQPIIINNTADVRGVLWLGYEVEGHYQSLHRDEQLPTPDIKLEAGNVPGNYLMKEQNTPTAMAP